MRKLLFSLILLLFSFQTYGNEPRVIELGTGTLHLDDVVTRDGIVALYLKALLTEGDVHILIDSPGGDFVAAQWLVSNFKKLRLQGKKIHCYGNGQVASAAFYIYLNCDKRYALKSTALFPHKIHIIYYVPMLPGKLVKDGLETQKEQQDWDRLAMLVTGMSPEDYRAFRDSDDDQWSIGKILEKSKNKWFELVDNYVVRY